MLLISRDDGFDAANLTAQVGHDRLLLISASQRTVDGGGGKLAVLHRGYRQVVAVADAVAAGPDIVQRGPPAGVDRDAAAGHGRTWAPIVFGQQRMHVRGDGRPKIPVLLGLIQEAG